MASKLPGREIFLYPNAGVEAMGRVLDEGENEVRHFGYGIETRLFWQPIFMQSAAIEWCR
jgi:hypothetical protein